MPLMNFTNIFYVVKTQLLVCSSILFIFNLFHYMHCCSIKMAYSRNSYILFINLWAIKTQRTFHANMGIKSCMNFITIHSKDGC
jgi:hypothetical protein